jgi:hypothetical protein
MNDFSELEHRLRRLRPVAPSQDLVTRIERALAEPETLSSAATSRWQWPWRLPKPSYKIAFGIAAAAAAAVLLIYARVDTNRVSERTPSIAAISTTRTPASSVASTEFVPAAATEVVYNRSDEGLRFPVGPDQPMRRIRYQKQETIQWRNPATGASLRVSYPAEEISLVPAPGQ